MTEREQFELDEFKLRMLTEHPYCEQCLLMGVVRPATQLAHRIPQTKHNLATYGKAIIHHPLNIACVCGLACNAAVNIEHRPMAKAQLIAEIQDDMRSMV